MNKDWLSIAGWLLRTEPRRRLMREVIRNPGQRLFVSNLARSAKTSKGMASIFLKRLKHAGLASRQTHGLILSLDLAFIRWIKKMENLSKGDWSAIRALPAKTVLLYGSRAQGTNEDRSDVDLCVVLRRPVSEEKLAAVEGQLSRSCGADVHLLTIDDKKRLDLKKNSPEFYYSLAYRSILLNGDPLET